jgi:putative sterol carrier protein
MTIEEYLRRLERAFLPERAAGRSAIFQYEFSGRCVGTCHVVIHNGMLRAAMGPHLTPSAVIESDFDLWLRLVTYEEEPLLAYQRGAYKVSGDLELLMEADTWFRH